MPFGFRKSFRVAPGVRVNLSKSGVGVSAGVRGLRVGTGPRGAYWRAGAMGFSYQQRIGAPPSRVPSTPYNSYNPGPAVVNTVLGPAPGVGDDLALRYGEARRRLAYLPWFSTFGLLAELFAFVNWPFWMAALLLAAVVTGAVVLAREDAWRRRILVEYTFDPQQSAAYAQMGRALEDGARCAAVWCVTTTSSANWKNHAGADALVTRVLASTARRAPAGFVTNADPWTIGIPGGGVTFLPDRLLIVRGNAVTDARYGDVRATDSITDFREEGAPPRDALRIGTTWLHPNKNGGPDRRFAHNPEVPIFRYGRLELTTGAVTIDLQFSQAGVAAPIGRAIRGMP